MSIIKKVQNTIREFPYETACAAISVAASAGAWYIVLKKTPSTSDVINQWLFDMNKSGYSVLALDPEEMKRWLTVANPS